MITEQEELLQALRESFQMLPNSSHASVALPIAEVPSDKTEIRAGNARTNILKQVKKFIISDRCATNYSYNLQCISIDPFF